MPRANLLQGLMLGIVLLLGLQYAWKQLGPIVVLSLLALVGLMAYVVYLVESGHRIAPKLAVHPLTGWFVRLVCRIRGTPLPAPPAQSTAGPALRTPSDFLAISKSLKATIHGQDAVIDRLLDELRRRITLRSAITDTTPREPFAVLAIVGGEGQGKRTLLEAIGRGVYPTGAVVTIDLGTPCDLSRQFASVLTQSPCSTIVLEHLEMASPAVVEQIRRAMETGELRDPANIERPLPLNGCLIGLTAIDPQLPSRYGTAFPSFARAVPFQTPTEIEIAEVVTRLLSAECHRHGIILDYADEKLVADLVAQYESAHGYRATAAQIQDRIAPEIVAALETKHHRLSIILE